MARGRLRCGFSLIELMAAVAIVGLLIGLALPRYRLFIARSRMAEAKTNLGIIYGLQQTYKAEFEKYAGLNGMGYSGKCSTGTPGQQAKNELGFRVTDCNELKYHYRASTSEASANANSNGSEIYPGCTGKHDVWNITSERKLEHLHNVIKKCKD